MSVRVSMCLYVYEFYECECVCAYVCMYFAQKNARHAHQWKPTGQYGQGMEKKPRKNAWLEVS